MRFRCDEKKLLLVVDPLIIRIFADLPTEFTAEDLRKEFERHGRNYTWRNIHKILLEMRSMELVAKVTYKKYRKLYSTLSEWIEKKMAKIVRRVER